MPLKDYNSSIVDIYQKYGVAGKSASNRALCAVLFFSLLAAYGLGILGMNLLGKCYFFNITKLSVSGSRLVSEAEILGAARLGIKPNLMALDHDELRGRIESLSWIRSVRIKKEWPNSLIIIVKEEKAAAMLKLDEKFYYLDKKGRLFADGSTNSDMDFPVISFRKAGVGTQDIVPLYLEPLQKAMEIILHAKKGSASLPAQNISEVVIEEDGELTMFLADNPFPIYLGKKINWQLYSRLSKALYWLYKKRQFDKVDYIRMNYFNNKALVGMRNTG